MTEQPGADNGRTSAPRSKKSLKAAIHAELTDAGFVETGPSVFQAPAGFGQDDRAPAADGALPRDHNQRRQRDAGGASNGDGDNRLRLLIERIERLEEEKKGIGDDVKDVYSEGKSAGYDTKIMRKIIRLRKMKPDDRREAEQLLATYARALGMQTQGLLF